MEIEALWNLAILEGRLVQGKYMAHPNMSVTFAHLRDVCGPKNLQVSMTLFECGHAVAVMRDGLTIIRGRWECGDLGPEGASQCANWLIEKGYLTVADFNGD